MTDNDSVSGQSEWLGIQDPSFLEMLPTSYLRQSSKHFYQSNSFQVRVASFNCLASCYAYRSSFPGVAWDMLSWKSRCSKLLEIIEKLVVNAGVDVIALQEVDRELVPTIWNPCFRSKGFEILFMPKPTKKADGCIIAWRSSKFNFLEVECISFDDAVPHKTLSSQFNQKNVAILVALQSVDHRNSPPLIVASAHIFWNPEREDVKLLQSATLMQSAERFRQRVSGSSLANVIICGDMNSLPESIVYRLFVQGSVNSSDLFPSRCIENRECKENSDVTFLCDATLNKLVRWLRMLGYDTASETAAEEADRAAGRGLPAVDRAKTEGRILLTASRSLLKRRACRTAMYIDMHKLPGSLADLFRTRKIRPALDSLLTRCVKCNGRILPLEGPEALEYLKIRRIVPEALLNGETRLYMCNGCEQVIQVYWWPEKKNSSAARALSLAESLHALVTAAVNQPNEQIDTLVERIFESSSGVRVESYLMSDSYFTENVNEMATKNALCSIGEIDKCVEQIEETFESDTENLSTLIDEPIFQTESFKEISSATEHVWPTDIVYKILRGEEIHSGIPLKSAYQQYPYDIDTSHQNIFHKEAPYTNATVGFTGTLDYIYHDTRGETLAVSRIPPIRDLSESLLPSQEWPSDHLCLVADICWPL